MSAPAPAAQMRVLITLDGGVTLAQLQQWRTWALQLHPCLGWGVDASSGTLSLQGEPVVVAAVLAFLDGVRAATKYIHVDHV